MKQLFMVETSEELQRYKEHADRMLPKIEEYIEFLKKEYAVADLPRAIVWTGRKAATEYINDIPVPAYTNDFRIVFTPDIEAWREIYLSQLAECEGETVSEIRDYYTHRLSENHILQILGHELAHHSELFLEDFNSDISDGIWFEEGMAEYISRRYFLTEEEFEAEKQINRLLVDMFKSKYGSHSLEEFGQETYNGDYASIFFEYWRSFLAVNEIIERNNNDVLSVFRSYQRWNEENSSQTLTEWFSVNI